MKASSHEKHAKQQWKKKSSDPWARSGERPGRGHGSELFVFFVFFGFSIVFCSLAKTSRKQKKKVQTHGQGLGYPHTNQKTKKPRNQKKQKIKKTKKKTRLHTPRGGGQMQSVGSCLFGFFGFFCFLFFWFFCFLVCVWIAIADVLSRDCQALSLVALEARSIHYSTAMFAMT